MPRLPLIVLFILPGVIVSNGRSRRTTIKFMYCLHGLRPLSSCIVPRRTFFHRGEFMRREYCPWKFLSAFCAHGTICRKNLVIILHELIVKSDFKVVWYLLYGNIFYLNFYWEEFGYSRDIKEFCNEFCSTQINTKHSQWWR